MSNVIYLVTGLSPYFSSLDKSKLPFKNLAEFDANAREQLSESEYKKMTSCNIRSINDWSGKGALRAYITDSQNLQKDIIKFRKAKQDEYRPNLSHLPESIIALNPLEREIAIMKWQWERLSDVEFLQNFTLTEIIIFRLKFQLVLRYQSFDTNKGSQLLEEVLKRAKSKEES